jgi:transglutaminase-like putative cysteine protease
MNRNLNIPIAMVLIQFLLQWQKLDSANILYLAFITSAVLACKLKAIKTHFLARHLGLIIFIAVQFIFEEYTITKDFFVNCLYILFLFKLLETENKNYFFFLSLGIFLTVANLINNQNLISSILSGANTVLIIILLYLINQRELIHINFGNLKRLIIVILVAVPTIIITYLLFPRTEVNINFFTSKTNNLGIPDTISLGTFEKITQNDQSVFDATFQQKVNQNQLYFRVKTFSILDFKKNWQTLDTKTVFKNNIQTFIKDTNLLEYTVLVNAYDKKWVPVLDYVLPVNSFYYDYHNLTYQLDKNIIKKSKFNFVSQITSPFKDINKKSLRYYLQLPKSLNNNLFDWANKNKKGKTDLDYLNFVMKHFQKNEYFYTLSPQPIGNNYSKFFFQSKEGYCEYYAGTMAILARAAGIPSRIVTGYYGGQYNAYGDFFTFSQQDSHSWVEAWIADKGWIRFDPTQVIPSNRIRSNINNFNINNQDETKENENFYKLIPTESIVLWFKYLDYQWSNFLLSYDSKKRSKLINEFVKLDKSVIFGIFLDTLLVLVSLFLFTILMIVVIKRNYTDFLFLILLKKLRLKTNIYDTHQNIFLNYFQFNSIPPNKALLYRRIVNDYEEGLFTEKKVNFFKFIKDTFQILFKK